MTARATVSPPTPESKIPIGAALSALTYIAPGFATAPRVRATPGRGPEGALDAGGGRGGKVFLPI